jgi:hypothetical protein
MEEKKRTPDEKREYDRLRKQFGDRYEMYAALDDEREAKDIRDMVNKAMVVSYPNDPQMESVVFQIAVDSLHGAPSIKGQKQREIAELQGLYFPNKKTVLDRNDGDNDKQPDGCKTVTDVLEKYGWPDDKGKPA